MRPPIPVGRTRPVSGQVRRGCTSLRRPGSRHASRGGRSPGLRGAAPSRSAGSRPQSPRRRRGRRGVVRVRASYWSVAAAGSGTATGWAAAGSAGAGSAGAGAAGSAGTGTGAASATVLPACSRARSQFSASCSARANACCAAWARLATIPSRDRRSAATSAANWGVSEPLGLVQRCVLVPPSGGDATGAGQRLRLCARSSASAMRRNRSTSS